MAERADDEALVLIAGVDLNHLKKAREKTRLEVKIKNGQTLIR